MVPRQDQNAEDERQSILANPSRAGWRRILATSRSTAAVFIVANSLTAGSIFCFPLFGPKMSADLGLSLTQTNAIWSAAILGQYASAAIFGHIADTYGPRPLSLMASILFGVGYVLMAHTESDAISHQQQSPFVQPNSNKANFIAMAAYFVLVGTGVAASIFSALRSSTSHFKSHPGLALSIPLTLFSLSSLFLSAFASLSFFTDPNTGDLNSPKWLAWLGAALMITNALSAFGLSVPAEGQEHDDLTSTSVQEQDELATERTSLLGSRPLPALLWSIPYGRDPSDYPREPLLSLKEYLSAPSVWIMGLVLFAGVGGAEMVMGSIGSIVVSLRAVHTALDGDDQDDKTRLGRETLALRTQQVQLLAIANTISRLLVGLLTDLCSPQGSRKQPSTIANDFNRINQPTWKKHLQRFTISRLTLLLVGLALLCVTFIYSAIFVDRVDRLWLVSLATGTGYGLTFTVLPSTIICVWPQQFGRNYGLLTYAAAMGSLFFSMLFANINDKIASRQYPIKMPGEKINLFAEVQQAICPYGRECFAPSFALAALIVAIAFFATIPLWRAWRRLL